MSAIQNWDNCSICQHILDGNPMRGTHDGLVALSKRCYHVFHKTCIEGWLEEGNRSCPNCNLQHFSICEVVLNPENTRQYQKWQADNEGYSYEQAFIDECGQSHEESGLPAEHILRPRELRGLERREELTHDEIACFFHEMHEAVRRLPENATQEQIDKAHREIVCAKSMMVKALVEGFEGIKQMEARNRANLQHELLLGQYYRKVDGLERKVRDRLVYLRSLPIEDRNYSLNQELSELSQALGRFDTEFRLNGRTNERSIAESRELLELVDAELDAFVAGQPEHIKEILNAEPPQPPPPAEENNEPWYQSTVAKIAMLFALVVGAITFRHYFWKGRNVQPQDEL